MRIRAWSGRVTLARLALGLIALALALTLIGGIATPALADGLDDETRQIAKQLQCPVCENLSVADSPSDLAGQMRGIIRKKLENGESRDTILQYFVDRYGDSILVSPPKSGFTLGIWLGPVIGLAIGAVMVYLGYRNRQAPRTGPAHNLPAVDDDDVEAFESVLMDDLRRYREGASR